MSFSESDKAIKRKLRDLCDVGTRKMVGYLPMCVIKEVLKSEHDIKDFFRQFARENGLKMRIFKETVKTTTASGALYMWEPESLKKFIKDHRATFYKYGITDANKYIRFLEYTVVFQEIDPIMYKLIGQTFSDYRFENVFDKYKSN